MRLPRRHFLLSLALIAAVLAPAFARAADTPGSLGSEGVVYPRNAPEAGRHRVASDNTSLWAPLGVIAVLAAGGFYLLKRGQLRQRGGVAVPQRLAIDETRSLGNKQYLAVASYGDRKLLLSVCPGRVELLCRLDDAETPAKPAAALAPNNGA